LAFPAPRTDDFGIVLGHVPQECCECLPAILAREIDFLSATVVAQMQVAIRETSP